MTSRIEACPNIAMEAMSHGAILVAADNPPLPEFFSDCTVYYEAGNSRSLAEVVVDRLAINLDVRSQLSAQTQKRSEMFSWDVTVDRTMTVLKQVTQMFKGSKDLAT